MYSYSTGEEINIVDVCVFGVSDVTSRLDDRRRSTTAD